MSRFMDHLPALIAGALLSASLIACGPGTDGVQQGDTSAETTGVGDQVEWVSIPGKTFRMSRTEVTVAQYRVCVDAGACEAPTCGNDREPNSARSDRDDHPVNCVDWHEATAFAEWSGGRLPTAAEWKYAAKGGETYVYAGSNDVREVAWYGGNSDGHTHPVCRKKRNGYGLCDMSGNVHEWTSTAQGSRRIYRGGSWAENVRYVRINTGFNLDPDYSFQDNGFRIVEPLTRSPDPLSGVQR